MSFGRRNSGVRRLAPSNGASPSDDQAELPSSDAPVPERARLSAQAPVSSSDWVPAARAKLTPVLRTHLALEEIRMLPRSTLAEKIGVLVRAQARQDHVSLDALDDRRLVTLLINDLLGPPTAVSETAAPFPIEANLPLAPPSPSDPIEIVKEKIQPKLMARLDVSAASALPRNELARQLGELVAELIAEEKFQLNGIEQRNLVTRLVNDMLGLGPLEPLLASDKITDIMVNGPHRVYVERGGKLELTDVRFRDDAHVMNIATRIVARIGRRIDESNPLCDARLPDGSRVNIIIPPLAIDGPSISIRKFSQKTLTLDVMVRQGNLSQQMASVLKIAGRSRLNILLSGGTGSGKTTMLNAISQMIDPGERVVTIEDAAELQLQQPHVVRLETRPANLEGSGEITTRDLIRNALRMRPDRIILGEVRGAEAVDMLQAMNTGHEGSLGTIHANRPREALTRLENMIGLAGINLMAKAVRTQISAALDMIVQVSRMRDGVRRVTQIMEVIGMEGDVVTTQDLFHFELTGETPDGRLLGRFVSSGLRPHCMPKAAYFGLEKALLEAMG